MLESLQAFTVSLPGWLQWSGILLAGAIPFIESYFGSLLGVVSGLPAPVAVMAASLGNFITMALLVLFAHKVRGRVKGQHDDDQPANGEATPGKRQRRLRAAFDRYGVAGVSLLGQTILPSQITATALVSFGARRRSVILWQAVSIVLWGTLFAYLTVQGVDLLPGAVRS